MNSKAVRHCFKDIERNVSSLYYSTIVIQEIDNVGIHVIHNVKQIYFDIWEDILDIKAGSQSNYEHLYIPIERIASIRIKRQADKINHADIY